MKEAFVLHQWSPHCPMEVTSEKIDPFAPVTPSSHGRQAPSPNESGF